MVCLKLLITLSWILCVCCKASVISLTSSEDVITPPLTRKMRMNCALLDTEKGPTGSSGSVGHDHPEKVPTGSHGQKAHCPEVTSTSSDVSFVTSIVLMRNGVETIASVTQLDPVQWRSSISSLSVVKGNLSRSSNGMKGYIELQWDYPGATDAGNYTCEVNAISRGGHNVVFTKTLMVEHSAASVDDVITSVAALHKQMDQMAAAVALGNTRHSEQGVLSCGSTDSWVRPSVYKNSYEREILVNQTFSQAYASKPLVQIGVINMATSSNNYNDNGNRFAVELADVRENGFSIRCYTENYSYYAVRNLTVSWLSVTP